MPAEQQHQWIPWVLAGANLAITIFGWFWVDRRNERRAATTELFKYVTETEDLVRSIVGHAFVYWGLDATAADEAEKRSELIVALSHLAGRLGVLKNRDSKFDLLNGDHVALRRACTSAPFDSAGRRALPTTDARFAEIAQAAQRFCGNLHLNFNRVSGRGKR